MKFTGRNLELVVTGLDDAMGEVHNRIATCPDVNEYAEDIIALEQLKTEYARLLARARKALERERSRK